MMVAELRAAALTKKLKSIRVEAMMKEGNMIYKGTNKLGNAFCADWEKMILQDIAAWHDEENK